MTVSGGYVVAGPRGCGEGRQEGGIYLETLLGPCGLPLTHFLVDPPQPVDVAAMNLPKIGTKIVERPGHPGVYDVWDRVSNEHYPNVADFYEEGKRMGFSRRIAKNSDFELLGPESRLVIVHDRGFIANAWQYADAMMDEAAEPDPERVFACPKSLPGHGGFLPKQEGDAHPRLAMCAGLWWHDLDRETCHVLLDPAKPRRAAIREMPAFQYEACARPLLVAPSHQPALCLVLPIHRLGVIVDKAGGSHEEAAERARKSRIDVEIEEA